KQQVQLTNAVTGAVVDSQTVSSFSDGEFLVWSIAGHDSIRFTSLAGPDAMVSGLFFDPPAAIATMIRRDTTTQGTGIGTHGAQGYEVDNSGSSYPSYATVNWNGTPGHTWAASTSDTRALQKVSGNGRTAAGWWDWNNFTVNVNLLDGRAH